MANRYFDQFPIINYNGYNVRDITVSAKLTNKFTNAPYRYYRTEVKDSQRAEQLADSYYGDPYMSWMVFYSNKIVDPYYGWVLSEKDFNDFLIKKYGSIEVTQQTIDHFKVNWDTVDDELTPSDFFDRFGEFTDPHSKYWNPIYDVSTDSVLYYVRKANDAVVNTNKLVKLVMADASIFTAGELVDIGYGSGAEPAGTAEVMAVKGDTLYLKNVLGEVGVFLLVYPRSDPDSFSQISSYASDYDPTADAWTIVNISDEEYVYWTPVYVYDLERQLNEDKKDVKLVEAALAVKVADQLEKELNG